MQIKKQQLEWNMEQCVGSKQGKKYNKAVYCHLAECITQNARLDEAQGGMKVEGRNINNLRYADDTTLMVWRGFKEPPDEGERGEWKAGLKLNIQNTKIMGSGPVASWQIDGETIETVTNFIFLGSKITVDSEYSHEIKKHLLLWKKNNGKPRQHIKKQRHYFAYKGPHSQSYGFSSSHVWTWELDHKKGWMLKNRCFQTVVLEKTLRSPLDCKRSNQSILKEINPQYSLEGLVLKLKLQYFGHLMWRADSLEKTLMLGKIEQRRKRAWQRMRWLDGVSDSMDMNLSKLQEMVKDREVWCATIHGVAKSWTWLGNWATTTRSVFSDHSIMKLKIKRKTEKFTNLWKLNN